MEECAEVTVFWGWVWSVGLAFRKLRFSCKPSFRQFRFSTELLIRRFRFATKLRFGGFVSLPSRGFVEIIWEISFRFRLVPRKR